MHRPFGASRVRPGSRPESQATPRLERCLLTVWTSGKLAAAAERVTRAGARLSPTLGWRAASLPQAFGGQPRLTNRYQRLFWTRTVPAPAERSSGGGPAKSTLFLRGRNGLASVKRESSSRRARA
jgi:hypothetical protein